jgi:hypothetical protein
MNVYWLGSVVQGFMNGSTALVTALFPNNDTSACDSEIGVTKLDMLFGSIALIRDESYKIVCFGYGTNYFSPGLRNSYTV